MNWTVSAKSSLGQLENNQNNMYSLEQIKEELYSAVISDALDSLGYRNQALNIAFTPYSGILKMTGRCKTSLWEDIYETDQQPYELELEAVDSCRPGEVLVCAAGGSNRSGIWGELLSTAAMRSGCAGALVHGSIRDIEKTRRLKFPVFACGASPYDSQHRQRVIEIDKPIHIGGVLIHPGEIIFADEDGVVVIPKQVEEETLSRSFQKVKAENITRDEIKNGMKAGDAYKKYGVL